MNTCPGLSELSGCDVQGFVSELWLRVLTSRNNHHLLLLLQQRLVLSLLLECDSRANELDSHGPAVRPALSSFRGD